MTEVISLLSLHSVTQPSAAICSHLSGAATDGAFPCLASLRIYYTDFNLGSGKLLSGGKI